jgi:hypothetical protein
MEWLRTRLLSVSLLVVLLPFVSLARENSVSPMRDGQHDFDFEIGTWRTHLRLLQKPLTGSKSWVEYEGTSVVRKLWNGRANLVELEVDGPGGHVEGLELAPL